MHKLMEIIERELHAVEEKGLTPNNLDNTYKLIDMYKDLKALEEHTGKSSYHHMEAMEKNGNAARFDRNLNELYDNYVKCKHDYKEKGAQMYKEKVSESLEKLMSEIGDLIFDIHRDCDFKEERDIVAKHMKSMQDVK